MTYYVNDCSVEKKFGLGTSATTQTISTSTTLDGAYSLYILDVTGTNQPVSLPIDANSTKGQIIEIVVLNTSSFSALIQQANTNLPFEGIVDPGQRISFLYDGVQWNGGKTVSADTEFGWGRTASYRGNAGTGTYLQWVFSGGSDDYPYLIPNDATIHTVSITTPATTTVSVGLFTWDGIIETSLGSITLTAGNDTIQMVDWDVLYNDKLRAKITSGTISKPTVEVYFRQR